MKTPAQSLLGSQASNLCHLYFCSQLQSLLHLPVVLLVQISWCMACSNSLLLSMALTLPLLLLARYGVTISILLEQTSSLPPLPCSGTPGKSACLVALLNPCSSPWVLFPPSLSSSSVSGWAGTGPRVLFPPSLSS